MRIGFRPEFPRARGFGSWLLLLLVAACQGRSAPVDPSSSATRTPTPEPTSAADADPLARARALAAQEDLNGALLVLDRSAQGHEEDPAYFLLYGDLSLRFLDQSLAAGRRDPGLVDGLLADAERAFRRAAELAPEDPRPEVGLAVACRRHDDLDAAYAAARKAEALLPAAAPGAGEDPSPWLELGKAGLALVAQRGRAGSDLGDAPRQTERWLQRARAAGSSEALILLADLYNWQGLGADARAILVEALTRSPEDGKLYERLKRTDQAAPADLVRDLEALRSAVPGNGMVLWQLGAAHYAAQLAARSQQDFLSAYEDLDRAEECFLQSEALRPDFAATCRTWLHLVRIARGWALWEESRVDDAAQAFLSALESDPSSLEAKSEPGNLRFGIDSVVGYAVRHQRLDKARAWMARAVKVADQDANWFNNLGFFCRELGVAAQAAGKEEKAKALFEQAWQAYGKSVALAPNDVRLVNDRALMAVYYLDHDQDLAERELHRAVEMGARQLAAMADQKDSEAYRKLDEAVGDAWENLAYLDVVRRSRTDRAPDYLRQSLQHYPFDQRGGVARIRARLDELLAAQAKGAQPEDGSPQEKED